MKIIIYGLLVGLAFACIGCGKHSPKAAAKKWCEITKKIDQSEGEERKKLESAREEFQDLIEEEHKDESDSTQRAFMDQMGEFIREYCRNR